MHRILIADPIAADALDYLRQQPDIEVETARGLDEDALSACIDSFDGLIVRSGTRATASAIAAGNKLKVIGRAGIGVDNIDVEAATEHGIVVLNTPDANATTTAELTIAHLLSLCRHLPAADQSIRSGGWERSAYTGTEVAGKTMGIIGYGTIGRLVVSRCQALQMQVIVYDPFVTKATLHEHDVRGVELEELLRTADFISLHCPVNSKTRGLINRERLALMQPHARLINCARGELIDETALYEALTSGRLAGAALDVYTAEPPAGSPLLQLPNVVFTPHLGASTHEAQTAVGSAIVRGVLDYLRSGQARNAVNLPAISGEELARLQPYLLLVRRLGRLLAIMIDEPLQALEVCLRGRAAELPLQPVATEALSGFLSEIVDTPVNQVNARSLAKRHGIALSESRSDEIQGYLSLIEITAKTARDPITLAGTVFDERHPRLVRINAYEVEAFLEGHILMTRHEDQPGVIGTLGTLLGEAGINIARMQLGIVPETGKAIAVLQIARPLPAELMQTIQTIPAIDQALQISL